VNWLHFLPCVFDELLFPADVDVAQMSKYTVNVGPSNERPLQHWAAAEILYL
jgi:hypothetical protein